MDDLLDQLIALTPIPTKWAWFFVLVIEIAESIACNYFIFYVLYPSAQYARAIYTSISNSVKLSILVGLISLYFCIVPQPWEKLYWLYSKFRMIDDRVKEAIRDRFRIFLVYDVGVRFSSVAPMRIPWEVYKWLAIQREWQALPPMTTQYRYDSINFKLKGFKGKATDKSSTLERAKSAQFTPSDIEAGVAQSPDFGNKGTGSKERKPGDISTNDSELEKPIAADLRLNNARPVTPVSDLSCNVSQPKDYRVIRLLKLSRWYRGGGIHAELIEAHLVSTQLSSGSELLQSRRA